MVSKISGRETAEHSCIHAPTFQDAESIVAENERETCAWPLEKNGRGKKRDGQGKNDRRFEGRRNPRPAPLGTAHHSQREIKTTL